METINQNKKIKIDKYALFRNANGKIKYNGKCTNCIYECKQSYRTEIVQCKHYIDRRKNDEMETIPVQK